MRELINNWQTLIGSFLGPFLAIILSAFGFLIKEKYQKRKDRKEAIRRAEISFAETLNHVFTSVEQLEFFIQRVKTIMSDIEGIDDEKIFSLNETNFPPTISIYFDDDLRKLKFKSYYLHNKILIIEYLVRWANTTINQFRDDFANILRKNEFLITREVNPKIQRFTYLQNLENYISEVERFTNSLKNENTKIIVQAKVYNLKLMEKHFLTLWKYERASLKYFKNKKEMNKEIADLKVLDKIDPLIETEVKVLLDEAKERSLKNKKL